MKNYSINDLKEILKDCRLIGNKANCSFTNFNSLEKADENTLVWIKPTKRNKIQMIQTTPSKAIIVDDTVEIENSLLKEKCFIITKNPKLTFLRIVNFLRKENFVSSTHPTAFIHPKAKIHPDTFIGPFTYIGEAIVGENTIIYGHCYIYDNVEIGKNCKIHAGTILGKDGFGYEKNENGEWESFPQMGKTLIGNNVDIGANVSIHRGALSDTIISDGVKIDDGTVIAHNVFVGKNCIITGQVGIAGSTRIGDNSWIGPGALILNQMTIGNSAFIGVGSVVIKNIKSEQKVFGNPARVID
jgi:UDP-3-O-[3-hydroxymyristoyl] glucosamine N-acyltransferase